MKISPRLLKKLIDENPGYYIFIGSTRVPQEWMGKCNAFLHDSATWGSSGYAGESSDLIYRIRLEDMVLKSELELPRCRDCGAITKLYESVGNFYIVCAANAKHTTGCAKHTKEEAIDAYPSKENE